MKLEHKKNGIDAGALVRMISRNELTAEHTETVAQGSYLEGWFRCLKLSKEYIQNCRTGIFPCEHSYRTFCLFGAIEDCTFKQWWHDRGFDRFRLGLTSLRIQQVVKRKSYDCFAITVDVYSGTPNQIAGAELEFWLQEIRRLNEMSGLLSDAPMTWSIYRSRISHEAIQHHLDVLEAYEVIIRNAPRARLWQIGEQLRLNPKAMTRVTDSPKEQVAKHISMGQTVDDILRKGRALVKNASAGLFPRFAS